jgi:hypothetical protein
VSLPQPALHVNIVATAHHLQGSLEQGPGRLQSPYYILSLAMILSPTIHHNITYQMLHDCISYHTIYYHILCLYDKIDHLPYILTKQPRRRLQEGQGMRARGGRGAVLLGHAQHSACKERRLSGFFDRGVRHARGTRWE